MTKTRSPEAWRLDGAFALVAALIASISVPGIVAAQSIPRENRVWAGCTLSPSAVTALTDSMSANQLGTPKQVAFVVIYSFLENDGQPLSTGGGFTGPVLCRNTAVAPNISQVLQTDNLGTAGAPVDVLDFENATILRYQASGATPGPVQKRICHSVDASSDCFNLR